MATTLDVVSHGRFQLGVGVGGEYPAEFDACGVPVGERGARADEALTVLRALWSGQPVDFEGRHASIRRLTLAPQPVQAGGPPIWVAGRSEAALRRAVRFGDGWMPYFRSPKSLARDVATLREIAEAGGRDPMGVRVGAVVFACVHDDRDRALSMISERLAANYAGDYSAVIEHQAAAGPPERCRARVEEYIEAGADTIFFATLAHPDHQGESEERLARQVVDPVRISGRS
jgi:alkanesulfonate monooxygenase SsuD/methylene tetrahydromethanopterin reductase-like flavin-dependent oxidoreductase (luciferase family)